MNWSMLLRAWLLSLTTSGSVDVNQSLNEAFEKIQEHEHTLVEPLLAYLRSKKDRGVLILGDEENGPSRVPTISFVVTGNKPIRSPDVVKYFVRKGNIGISYGHFYALAESFSPPSANGAVRISLVHSNTLKEVQALIDGLKEVLKV